MWCGGERMWTAIDYVLVFALLGLAAVCLYALATDRRGGRRK